jgi:Superfamily II DNA and RNA helicases
VPSPKRNTKPRGGIQAQTIPVALTGRDIVGIAQTGTGKTASFALPILNHIVNNRMRPMQKAARVLVLSPTRELSGQIADSFRTYGRHIRPLTIELAIGRRADQPAGARHGARRPKCWSRRRAACSTSSISVR